MPNMRCATCLRGAPQCGHTSVGMSSAGGAGPDSAVGGNVGCVAIGPFRAIRQDGRQLVQVVHAPIVAQKHQRPPGEAAV